MLSNIQLVSTLLIVLFSSSITFCQEFSWQKVNPWRLESTYTGTNKGKDIYFYNRDELFLLNKENLDLDTIELDFDLDIGRLLFRSNEDIVITAGGTDGYNYSFYSEDMGESFEVFNTQELFGKYFESDDGMIREARSEDSIFLYYVDDYLNEKKVLTVPYVLNYELSVIDSTIFVFLKKDVLYSVDNGGDWDTLTFEHWIFDVAVNNIGGYSYSGELWEIYNYNAEMEFVDVLQFDGFEFGGIKRIYSVEFFDEVIYVSSVFTLYKSIDGGGSWQNIVDRPRRYQRGFVDFVKISEKEMYFFSDYGHEILDITNDEFIPLNSLYLDIIGDVSIVNDTTYFMTNVHLRGSNVDLWKTTNKGVKWNFVGDLFYSDTSVFYYVPMDFIDELHGVYIHPDTYEIMATDNAGEDWPFLSNSPIVNPHLIEYVGEDSLYVCNAEACYFTVDGGMNWNELPLDIDGQSYRWDFYEIDINSYWIYGVDKMADSLTIIKVEDFEVVESFSSPYEVGWRDIRFDGLQNGNMAYSHNDRIIELDWETMDTTSLCVGSPETVLLTAHNKDSLMILENSSLYLINNSCNSDEGINYDLSLDQSNWFSYKRNYFDDNFEGIMFGGNSNQIWKYTKEIDESIFVGVEEENQESTDRQSLSYVAVFPNPTDGLLNIPDAYKKSKKTILDMTGKCILITEDDVIDMSVFSSGIYFLEFVQDNKRKGISKVVVY